MKAKWSSLFGILFLFSLACNSINKLSLISTSVPRNTPELTITRQTSIIQTQILTSTPTNIPFSETEDITIRVSEKDGMVMMFIPGGDMLSGTTDTEKDEEVQSCMSDGSSQLDCILLMAGMDQQETVYVGSFWIDQTEVTNAMYEKCVQSGSCAAPNDFGSSTRDNYYGNDVYNNYPVVNIDWNLANKYCEWAGRRLPIYQEWEKAARGTDGRIFPWGNTQPNCDIVNYYNDDGSCGKDTTEVGSYPQGASIYGIQDMVGNVSEWVNACNSQAEGTGDCETRGGGWNSKEWELHVGLPIFTHVRTWGQALGFRCVWPPAGY
jgi:eukaryotic-like serine/threonine-protein kinase